MKKNLLSCLTLLMVMLVSGVASAQVNVTLPGKNMPTDIGGVVPLKTGHIYICVSELRPIDLTYDVLGTHLPEHMGGWSSPWTTDNQLLTSPTNNTGGLPLVQLAYDGRNVFKANNTTVGTYLFTFEVTQPDFCDLPVNSLVFAFVHVLPDFALNTTAAWYKCENEAITALAPSAMFSNTDLQVISNAGYLLNETAYAPAIPLTALTTTSHVANVAISVPVGMPAYPCNATSNITLTINVVDTVDVSTLGGSDTVCIYSFPPNVTNDTEMNQLWFNSLTPPVPGAWSSLPATIDWVAEFSTVGTAKTYTFNATATACNPAAAINFTMTSVAKFDTTLRVDYATCDATQIPALNSFVSTISASIVDWVSLGTDPGAIGSFPGSGGDPMLPTSGGAGAHADFSKFAKGNKYYFLYHTSALPSECFVGTVDTVTIIVNLANSSQDGRLQTCKTAQTVDLAAALGLPATGIIWTPTGVAPAIDATGKVTVLATTGRNVYRYTYNRPVGTDGCGGGSGVFYLKVTDKIIVMDDVIEKFCHLVLPESTNIYYLAGLFTATASIVPDAATAAILALGTADYFDATTGVLDIQRLKNDLYKVYGGPVSLKFEVQNPGCGASAVNVEILITDILI